MWDRRLQGVEAIVQRQQCMPPEGNNHRFLIRTQNRGTGFRRAGLAVLQCLALAPFGDCLDVDAKFPTQRRVRSLRSLYECSDGVRALSADLPCKSPAG